MPLDDTQIHVPPALKPASVGRRGEAVAARYLVREGWRILARNARAGHKEIDLIATREGVIAFVEVKTRTGMGFGHPLEAITWKKRREIAAVARAWLASNDARGLMPRFDAIAVLIRPGAPPGIEHVPDAWRL